MPSPLPPYCSSLPLWYPGPRWIAIYRNHSDIIACCTHLLDLLNSCFEFVTTWLTVVTVRKTGGATEKSVLLPSKMEIWSKNPARISVHDCAFHTTEFSRSFCWGIFQWDKRPGRLHTQSPFCLKKYQHFALVLRGFFKCLFLCFQCGN